MQVVHLERQAAACQHSIERVGRVVRTALPGDISVRVVRCPGPGSRWWLVRGAFQAVSCRSQVAHLVGDVHYAALALRGGTTVLTIHDLNRLGELRGLRGLLYRWLYFSLPLWHCAAVTVISEETRRRVSGEFPFARRKLTVIPDPVPPEFVYEPALFNQNCPRILQVGTAPNKNLARLVAALDGVPCRLHVVGQMSEEMLGLIARHRVETEVSTNLSDREMLNAYRRADLVAFASLSEGFGMPIIEAQAVGRPVITSDIAPMRDVAGGGAALVDPGDVASIRKAILSVITDPGYRSDLVAKGRENAGKYAAVPVAAQYAALYRRLQPQPDCDRTKARPRRNAATVPE